MAEMWRAHEGKVIVLTPGGLTGGWKQSKKPVVTTNGEKSAEAIVLLYYGKHKRQTVVPPRSFV
jgi:hypothetical protein